MRKWPNLSEEECKIVNECLDKKSLQDVEICELIELYVKHRRQATVKIRRPNTHRQISLLETGHWAAYKWFVNFDKK